MVSRMMLWVLMAPGTIGDVVAVGVLAGGDEDGRSLLSMEVTLMLRVETAIRYAACHR
jgi:hypothetical protein